MAQYICSKCGYGSASWYGKCPSCGEWNTLEARADTKGKRTKSSPATKAEFTPLAKLSSLSTQRFKTNIHEFDRVVGGGFIKGEVVLIAGEPGVGKSTLLLRLLSSFRTMYVSGEESGEQIKQRADRVKIDTSKLLFSYAESVESIVASLEARKKDFDMIVIDSIQTIYSEAVPSGFGSVSQIKESVNTLTDFAKRADKILIVVGHVTKGGDIAGPKTLEHLVDCVLYLEGERHSHFRLLRATKNRFGPTDEVGIFAMTEQGMSQVDKPTIFMDEGTQKSPGRALVASVEGSRALFYEIQSLVVPTTLPVPRRVASGVDYNRLQLLLAVIRKHMKISLDKYDVYVNVVGGLSAKSPAADLGIIASVVSSVKDTPLPANSAFIGEVGLLGEVRAVYGEQKAIADAQRFGLKKIYTSKTIPSIKNLSTIR